MVEETEQQEMVQIVRAITKDDAMKKVINHFEKKSVEYSVSYSVSDLELAEEIV
jgi:hypothetical protein